MTGSKSAATAFPASGGIPFEINVADLTTGQISTSEASGLGVDTTGAFNPYGDTPMYMWGLSADGSVISWGMIDASQNAYGFYRQVLYPWVTNPAQTFGFQPYDAYVSDPVNVATGSFTNESTDIPAPAGVYSLDFTRSYNSADPTFNTLGAGWLPGFSSRIYTKHNTALVRYDNGKQVIYTQSGSSYVAPSGEANSLTHNGDGTWRVGFPSGEHWDYDSSGVLQSRTASDGQSVALTYTVDSSTGANLLTSVTAKNASDAQDGTLTLAYDSNDFLKSVSSSDGDSTGYTVTNNTLTSFVDRSGQTWGYTPDGLGRIQSESDPDGNTIVSNTYDENGRVISQTSQTGTVTQLSYDFTSGTTTVTDVATSQALNYVVDKTGRVTSVTDPNKGNATVKYENGYPISVTDRNNVTQTAKYDAAGNLLWLRDPSQTNASNSADPNAGKTSYTYDSQNRVESETQPDGTETDYCYTQSGGCFTGTFTQPYTVTVKDAQGTQVAQSIYSYDSAGNVETATNPDGVVTHYENYTTTGQPQKVTVGGNETDYTYFPDGSVDTVIDPMGNETDYTYSPTGEVLTQTGPYAPGDTDKIVTVNTYDNAGNLVTTTGPAYQNETPKPVTTNCYDEHGSGNTLNCYVTGSGQLMTSQDADGGTTHYVYNADGQPWKITDPDGNLTTDTYGDLGRLATEKDGAGLITGYGYDADGNQTSVSTPNGETSITNYNTLGQVAATVSKPTSTSDPTPARTSTIGYDAYGRQNSSTDPGGATTTTNIFDAMSRPTKTTDARGGIEQTTYTDGGNVATTTDPAGRVTTNCYDTTGSPCYVSGTGLLMSVTGPALPSDATPPVTSYLYNSDGETTQVTSPTGEITKMTYWPNGKVKTDLGPDGVETDFTYDARGNELTEKRLTNTDQSTYSTISYVYDFKGDVTQVTDADNHVTTYHYDANGNRINEIDDLSQGASPAHYAWQWTYDGDGNVKTVTDGLGRVTTETRNPTTGLLDSVADPSARTTTYGYDFAGEATSRQFTNGATVDPATTYSYDANGRPTGAVDPTEGTNNYTYDPAGDLIKAVQPGGRTSVFGYDTAGRRTSLTYPDGQSVAYGYDKLGLVSSITPQQQVADTFTGVNGSTPDPSKWAYVASTTVQSNKAKLALTPTVTQAGMLSLATPSVNTTARVSYQFSDTTTPQTLRLIGRLIGGSGDYEVRITSNSTTAQLAKVDSAGNVTNLASFTVPEDTSTHDVRIEVNGSTIEARVWADGTTEPSTWDVTTTDTTYSTAGYSAVDDNQTGTATASVNVDDWSQSDPSSPPVATSSYSYDNSGRMTSETLPGSAARTWHYTNGQLDTYTQTGVGTAVNDTIGYDPVGRLHTINSDHTYGYDPADQLTSETNGSTTIAYGYDGDGRRSTLDSGTTHLTYGYDTASELKTISDGTAFTYDAAGRELTQTGPGVSDTYGYDDGGRLGTVTETNGSTTTNETRTYDGYDNLTTLADTTGTTTVNSTLDWDPTQGVAALLADTRNGATTDITGLNNWDTTTTGGTTSAVGVDVYGSVTNTPGQPNLTCATSYTAYGTTTATPTSPCLGYRGDLTAGGLDYLHARNYNPNTGNFTTVDPQTGTPGTDTVATPYPYANNNPIANTDPTGMYAVNDASYDLLSIGLPSSTSDYWNRHNIRYRGMDLRVNGYHMQSCVPPGSCITSTLRPRPEAGAQGLAIYDLLSQRGFHGQEPNGGGIYWEVSSRGRVPSLIRSDIVVAEPSASKLDVYEARRKGSGRNPVLDLERYVSNLQQLATDEGSDVTVRQGLGLLDFEGTYTLSGRHFQAWGDRSGSGDGVIWYKEYKRHKCEGGQSNTISYTKGGPGTPDECDDASDQATVNGMPLSASSGAHGGEGNVSPPEAVPETPEPDIPDAPWGDYFPGLAA